MTAAAVRRDPGIDALRALAVVGVVTGHWLVTCLVLRPDGALAAVSPLAGMPWLAPVTWLLQTLGLFFFVAGFASHRSAAAATPPHDRGVVGGHSRHPHLSSPRSRGRWGGVGRAVGALFGAWALALAVAAVAGVPEGSLRTVAKLVVSPLWFLVVLLVLGALTRPVRRLVAHRWGPALVVAAGLAVVAAADAGAGWAPVTTVAAWLVPYALGMAAAAGRLRRRAIAWALLLAGAAGVLALVLLAGYPATAVGVPGAGRSNLNPPSLAALALALAQVGAAVLVRERLGRPRRAVTRVNRACLGVYLWHQSAMIVVTVLAARLAGLVTGLHTTPDGPAWIGARALWLPAFAVTLWLIVRTVDPARPYPLRVPAGCTLTAGSGPARERAHDPSEVIAVRDGDPPSRGRAARQIA